MFLFSKPKMPTQSEALPGRPEPILSPKPHTVLGTPIAGPYPDGFQVAEFALGCFWGEEKTFWQQPGVWTTAVGYEGGYTPNPTYQESVTGRTGHAETVRVVFDPSMTSYEQLLKVFWENHDPTQGNRQGNDVGTQYRSAIYTTTPEQAAVAEESRKAFAPVVAQAGYGEITTEIAPLREFYYAEDYHQQYLSDAKNPYGYCNHGPNGMSCPIGVAKTDS